ncbi:hypothetical protein SAMD00019534_109160 [Acytostelium subglobosum LB1]|uniref:hypothetical protein n=1 Tax=Acytostelium subglobosum LB1 TaxID=1410327 RepID=UPI000644ABB9|nr:hypothetical protein SAMD00019534_109160 [Acytostelium subglobosum LB1]GAM27740.1 hypothetical protein SAMD00019534_109160 [Acytostelium subglobosum LB1]|eukprot:XP_012749399.1 hypothetical protein SAMD00019534_109160 [Acytostelium subglobosum LB1]
MNKLIVSIFALLIVALVVVAEDVAVTEPVDAAAPAAVPSDVSFSYIFPDYPNNEFPAGSVVEVLVGFGNNGDAAYNISSIFASLNHPQDMNYVIQNYSRGEFGITVKPGQHTTLSYRFVPDAMLDPRPFGLIVAVDYRNEQQNFTQALFNSTINIVERASSFDIENLFLIIFALAIIGLVGFVVYNKMPKSKKTRRVTGDKTSSNTISSDDASDWLSGTSADSPKVAKKVTSPSAVKKNK